jgi:hypothetical protein
VSSLSIPNPCFFPLLLLRLNHYAKRSIDAPRDASLAISTPSSSPSPPSEAPAREQQALLSGCLVVAGAPARRHAEALLLLCSACGFETGTDRSPSRIGRPAAARRRAEQKHTQSAHTADRGWVGGCVCRDGIHPVRRRGVQPRRPRTVTTRPQCRGCPTRTMRTQRDTWEHTYTPFSVRLLSCPCVPHVCSSFPPCPRRDSPCRSAPRRSEADSAVAAGARGLSVTRLGLSRPSSSPSPTDAEAGG